jgi:hypothetical protein
MAEVVTPGASQRRTCCRDTLPATPARAAGRQAADGGWAICRHARRAEAERIRRGGNTPLAPP